MDIGLLIPATIPQAIVDAVKFVGIGIKRPYPLPQVIAEVLDVGQV